MGAAGGEILDAIGGPPPAGESSPLVGCITIDATENANDEGQLELARTKNPDARPNHSRKEAIEALAGGEPNKIIIGHGNAGKIITGGGTFGDDTDLYIASSNENKWAGPLRTSVQGCTSLTLYACGVAAGDGGRRFMNMLTDAIQAPVWAVDGDLRIDKDGIFRRVDGATWLVATPHQHLPMQGLSASQLWQHKTGAKRVGPPSGRQESQRIEHIEVRGTRNDADDSTYELTFNGSAATAYFRDLFLSGAIAFDSRPLAVTTASISVLFADGTWEQYEVLNDRLMRNSKQRKTYFRITSPLEGLFATA